MARPKPPEEVTRLDSVLADWHCLREERTISSKERRGVDAEFVEACAELADLRGKAEKWDEHEAIRRCHLCCDDGRRRDASDLVATICDHKEPDDGKTI